MKRHQSAFKLQATNPRKLQSNVSQFHTKKYLAKSVKNGGTIHCPTQLLDI